MKTKKKPAKKKDSSISPGVETLLRETEQSLDAGTADLSPLLPRLGPFTADEQEEFFLALLKREGEKLVPLLESVMGREEKIDLALARALGRWNSPPAGELLHRLVSR